MAYESSPLRAAIRDRLIDELLAVSVEGTITHAQIATIIGARTTSPDAIKHAAFARAANEHGAVFENIRGVGYRRIPASAIPRIGHSARQSIRNKARKSSRKIVSAMAANSNSMTNDDRLKAHAEVSVLGIIQASAGRGAVSRAYSAAQEAHRAEQQTSADLAKAMSAAVLGRVA